MSDRQRKSTFGASGLITTRRWYFCWSNSLEWRLCDVARSQYSHCRQEAGRPEAG
jgi:hypothetical protein